MTEKEKPEFCRAIATLRAMYPNEFNMSELVPIAYWAACRTVSLGAVKEAAMKLIRSPEWLRQMPPAPVLAEQARILERRRQRRRGGSPVIEHLKPAMTEESRKWVDEVKTRVAAHMSKGSSMGRANVRAIIEMLDRGGERRSADVSG